MSYLAGLHRALLAFFPTEFQRKYAREIQALFDEGLIEARRHGERA
ncbi:MAG: hypothetical protein V3T83_19440 [Acidobacteriota bacterium]